MTANEKEPTLDECIEQVNEDIRACCNDDGSPRKGCAMIVPRYRAILKRLSQQTGGDEPRGYGARGMYPHARLTTPSAACAECPLGPGAPCNEQCESAAPSTACGTQRTGYECDNCGKMPQEHAANGDCSASPMAEAPLCRRCGKPMTRTGENGEFECNNVETPVPMAEAGLIEAIDASATALEERGAVGIYRDGKTYSRILCVEMAHMLRRHARSLAASKPTPVLIDELQVAIDVLQKLSDEGEYHVFGIARGTMGIVADKFRRHALSLTASKGQWVPWRKVSEILPTDDEMRDERRTVVVLYLFDDGTADIDSPLWLPAQWKMPHMRTPDFWCFLDELHLPAYTPPKETTERV